MVWTVGEAALLCYHVNKVPQANDNITKHHKVLHTLLTDDHICYTHKRVFPIPQVLVLASDPSLRESDYRKLPHPCTTFKHSRRA